VSFNDTAYCDEATTLSWINHDLIAAFQQGPGLLALDVVSFHTSPEVKALLKSHNITYSYIPLGCTGLVQPLDVAVNKIFKAILWEVVEEEMDQEPRLNNQFSVGDRRICMAKCVAEARDILHRKIIQSRFCRVGLSLST